METAAREDRHVAAASTASLEPSAVEPESKDGGDGGEWSWQRQVDPETFEPLMYAQLALTSPPIDPDDCRYAMAWCGMMWCGIEWYGMVWYGMT